MTDDQFLQFQALGSEALQIKYLETIQVQAKEKTLQEKEITRRRELDTLGLILTRRIIYLNNIFINYINKLNNNKCSKPDAQQEGFFLKDLFSSPSWFSQLFSIPIFSKVKNQ